MNEEFDELRRRIENLFTRALMDPATVSAALGVVDDMISARIARSQRVPNAMQQKERGQQLAREIHAEGKVYNSLSKLAIEMKSRQHFTVPAGTIAEEWLAQMPELMAHRSPRGRPKGRGNGLRVPPG